MCPDFTVLPIVNFMWNINEKVYSSDPELANAKEYTQELDYINLS